jgi:hypothetical protein
MYMLDAQGRHVDPGATENENCDDLVEGLIMDIGEIRPTKAALAVLFKMGASERTQGWFPNNLERGMRLLGEPLKKCPDLPGRRGSASHGGGHMWAARCRVVRPDGTRGLPSHQKASDEYAEELTRTGRKEMPVTRRFYVGLLPRNAYLGLRSGK